MSPFSPKTRIPVAVLGATGAVGQSFIRFLADHPWFDVAQLAASERSAGKTYADATRWIGGSGIPEAVRSDAASWATSNQGWSAKNRMND